jgi:hypothetical protein
MMNFFSTMRRRIGHSAIDDGEGEDDPAEPESSSSSLAERR